MKQTNNVYAENMTIGAHYSYNQSVLKRAKNDPVISSKPQLAPLLTQYEAAFLVEEEKFKISQKSEFTDTLNMLDENRDNAYRGFKQIVGGYAKVPDAEIQKAAKAAGQLITDYRINVDVQRDQESGLLSNFIADLEGKCAAHVQTLHLEEVVQVMKAANDQYIAIRENRTEERMLKEKKALETARAATDAAYRSFIAMVNALAMVEGDADYANFIDYMNTLINEYKTEVLNQKPSSTTPSQPETEGDTPTDTPADPETPDTGGNDNTGGGNDTPTPPDTGGGDDYYDENGELAG
ncbi:MAG: hypothetical protein IKZ17_01010 [Bacteroidaceae bacterium]|nr:hypothetical protein [Bacteroidaceae bacterium]